MTCTWEDGYDDARERNGRAECDCDDYHDGYSAGRRYNERQAEERAAQEQYEYDLWMQAKQEAAEREAYDEQHMLEGTIPVAPEEPSR